MSHMTDILKGLLSRSAGGMPEISTDAPQIKNLFSLHIWTDVEGIKPS